MTNEIKNTSGYFTAATTASKAEEVNKKAID